MTGKGRSESTGKGRSESTGKGRSESTGKGRSESTVVHSFRAEIEWTGNRGEGTSTYRSYDRAYNVVAAGKPPIPSSSDPAFRGDPARYNPEDLLVASLSGCHLLWYLHLCSEAGVVVTAYRDRVEGWMELDASGGGRFRDVLLRPTVTIEDGSDPKTAEELHHRAHDLCFIANSVNFPVRCEPETVVGAEMAPSIPSRD